MDILDKIITLKKERISAQKTRVSLSELKDRCADAEGPRDFRAALTRGPGQGLRLIAEIKKASPSKGLIRADFNPEAIAGIYDTLADAISMLTEEDHFQGSLAYLPLVKNASSTPVLRKDFIVDAYQVYESRAAGADAILLIEAALDGSHASDLMHLAGELGMAVLFEVHDARELQSALRIEAPIIGINNRNLKTLTIDMQTTFGLLGEIPDDRTVVSESGISTRADVIQLEATRVDAMLVGTTIMKAEDIAKKIRELRGSA